MLEVESFGGCPGDTLTLKCSVQNYVLEWYCLDDWLQIFCGNDAGQLLSITCYNQTLTPVSHGCIPTDTITSVAEIQVFYNTTLICMNPQNALANESISIIFEGESPFCEYSIW